MAKFSAGAREALSKKFDCLWENDDAVDECRACNDAFTMFCRQHHCRSCGGIYCADCCPGSNKRICVYCTKGMTPGSHIVRYQTDYRESIGDKYGKASHIFDNTVFIPLPKLSYGSLYNDNFIRLDERAGAHTEGYFQFTNRSDSMCAVKIVAEGANLYNEVSRPPFLTVIPFASVYSLIEGLSSIYVIILYDNPNTASPGQEVVYTADREKHVSPCCKVRYFGKYSMYEIRCRHKNVLVKYKDEGALEPRSGTSRRLKHKAAGFFSSAFSSTKSNTTDPVNTESELDFSTNTEDISEILV